MTYALETPAWVHQFDGVLDGPSPFSYGAGEPPAGVVPFSSASKFNTKIPSSPTVAGDSSTIIEWINSLSGPANGYIGTGGTVEDFGHPVYYTAIGNPLLRLKRSGAANPNAIYTPVASVPTAARKISLLQNRLIRVPAFARAAAGSDHHMVLVTANYAYEFHLAQQNELGEGRLTVGCDAVYALSGNGMPEVFWSATASGVSLLSGQIRLCEIEAGLIPHAIAINIEWVRANEFIAPANGCATPHGTAGGEEDLKHPLSGARLQLNYTKAEIEALSVPAWKKTILQAMREYGCIINDTSGAGSWNINLEDGQMDVAQGKEDRWKMWAAKEGLSKESGYYVLPLKATVDWTKLRVVEV